MRAAVVLTAAIAFLGVLLPAMAQTPPPYIQPGFVFVYQMVDLQKQQPENAYHRYAIESVTPQGIRISIVSDIMKPVTLTVNANGEIQPGVRIDLWIPPGLSPGTRLKFGGVDAVVVQSGYDAGQGLKVTFVASADQTMAWVFIEDGPQPFNQLKQLLYAIYLLQNKKAVYLVNIQQGGTFTSTSTYTTTSTFSTTTEYTTQQTTVIDGSTVTTFVTTSTTVTVTSTLTSSTVSTYTTSVTQTNTVQPEPVPSPIPLTVAIPVAAVIVGGGFFYMRSRRRPLPPTYPYPPYSMPPPGYQPQPPMPPAYQQPAMACPACRFPVYPGEFVCRRCGLRVR
jgi:hypothetical protein